VRAGVLCGEQEVDQSERLRQESDPRLCAPK